MNWVDEFTAATPWKCYWRFDYVSPGVINSVAITDWQQSNGKLRFNNAVGIPTNQWDGKGTAFSMWLAQPQQFGNGVSSIRYSYQFGYEMPGDPWTYEIEENSFGQHPAYLSVSKSVRMLFDDNFDLEMRNFPNVRLRYDHPQFGSFMERWLVGDSSYENTSDWPKTGTVELIRELRQSDSSHRLQVKIDGVVEQVSLYVSGQVVQTGDWTAWRPAAAIINPQSRKYEFGINCDYQTADPANGQQGLMGEAFATRLEVSTEVV